MKDDREEPSLKVDNSYDNTFDDLLFSSTDQGGGSQQDGGAAPEEDAKPQEQHQHESFDAIFKIDNDDFRELDDSMAAAVPSLRSPIPSVEPANLNLSHTPEQQPQAPFNYSTPSTPFPFEPAYADLSPRTALLSHDEPSHSHSAIPSSAAIPSPSPHPYPRRSFSQPPLGSGDNDVTFVRPSAQGPLQIGSKLPPRQMHEQQHQHQQQMHHPQQQQQQHLMQHQMQQRMHARGLYRHQPYQDPRMAMGMAGQMRGRRGGTPTSVPMGGGGGGGNGYGIQRQEQGQIIRAPGGGVVRAGPGMGVGVGMGSGVQMQRNSPYPQQQQQQQQQQAPNTYAPTLSQTSLPQPPSHPRTTLTPETFDQSPAELYRFSKRSEESTLSIGMLSFADRLLKECGEMREFVLRGFAGGEEGGGGGGQGGEVERIRLERRNANSLLTELDERFHNLPFADGQGDCDDSVAHPDIPQVGQAVKDMDHQAIERLLDAYQISFQPQMFLHEKKLLYLRFVGAGRVLMHRVVD
ncbi:hypothetical protein K402DRAFT_456821 [Aulographum hederae CBS 113979]|uniref:Uncharacterized protein n=1 Tax=Aulographum hederae CBS 113979 TaxID=1176131 RepID=A0A6G1GQX2_9PEZI|nr:hypothetical protein K402DRAFT_456821 [Aulographum hederae CBS 113979]